MFCYLRHLSSYQAAKLRLALSWLNRAEPYHFWPDQFGRADGMQVFGMHWPSSQALGSESV